MPSLRTQFSRFNSSGPDACAAPHRPPRAARGRWLAPAHQRRAREARFGPQHDARLRPACADLPDGLLNRLERPGRPVDIGRPQPRQQRLAAAEDVQRQVTVVVVAAVEEAPLLLPVQRHIRRIEVEHDLGRGRAVRVEEQFDEQPLDRLAVGPDAVVAGPAASWEQLQPVQGALAGEQLMSFTASTPNTASVRSRS